MAQTRAQAHSWKQRPHTLGSAVEAIGEGAPHLIRWLLCKGSALKVAVGRGKGHRTLGLAIPQMPDHATTDDGGQIHLIRQAPAVLLIGEEIDGQRQATPGQHAHQALVTQRTHQTIEGHR
ncbi:MAG TPA: hypothetical protein VLQ80_15300 [Candidatus Saccharimonadia bacterium]|nr:hypothetical protein [Candidatus Saccharimonadia bacterium]